MTTAEQQAEVQRFADTLVKQQVDWATFYREVLGPRGIVRRMYPTGEAQAAFEQTDTYQQIQQTLTVLRRQGPLPPTEEEPTRVITVRLPKSLHEALRAEAHQYQTSMNQLCISKLLQYIDNQMVPTDL